MSSKKPTTRRIKNSQHIFCLQTVLKLARWQAVAEIGFYGTWDLQKRKAFDRKYSSCIRLWNTTMKNWFRHHLENFISFPLIYRFAGIRRVLTDLEADHWKHRSNYTVTLIRPHFCGLLVTVLTGLHCIMKIITIGYEDTPPPPFLQTRTRSHSHMYVSTNFRFFIADWKRFLVCTFKGCLWTYCPKRLSWTWTRLTPMLGVYHFR